MIILLIYACSSTLENLLNDIGALSHIAQFINENGGPITIKKLALDSIEIRLSRKIKKAPSNEHGRKIPIFQTSTLTQKVFDFGFQLIISGDFFLQVKRTNCRARKVYMYFGIMDTQFLLTQTSTLPKVVPGSIQIWPTDIIVSESRLCHTAVWASQKLFKGRMEQGQNNANVDLQFIQSALQYRAQFWQRVFLHNKRREIVSPENLIDLGSDLRWAPFLQMLTQRDGIEFLNLALKRLDVTGLASLMIQEMANVEFVTLKEEWDLAAHGLDLDFIWHDMNIKLFKLDDAVTTFTEH